MRYMHFRVSIVAELILSVVLMGMNVRAEAQKVRKEADVVAAPKGETADATVSRPDDAGGETSQERQGDGREISESVDAQCLPACRGGFTCIQGRCVSPCNPQCDPGQVCTRNGFCLPTAAARTVAGQPAAPSPVATSSGTATPTVSYLPVQPPVSDRRKALNELKYREFVAKKHAGTAMMVVGSMMIAVAVGLGAGAGASGEEALLFAGIGVELVGDVLLFPGIAVYSVGKNGMAKAEANFYTSRNNVGLNLSFAF